MLPNPYTPGQVPRVLSGRDRERSRIRDHLIRIEAFGELGGPLLVFHGPRGVGKTSLLRAAEADAREAGFVTVWVAATPKGRLLAELVRGTGRALEGTQLHGKAGRAWRARLDSVQVELGVPGVKVATSFKAEPSTTRAELGAGSAPIALVYDLLHDAATLVRDAGAAGLLVFIDEIHAAAQPDLAVVLNVLQLLDGARTENPLAVFAAGLPSTPEAITRAATFGERSTFLTLSRLSETDAIRALLEPATSLDVSWEPEALRAVAAAAGGYPYFLQLLGSTTWEAARPDAQDRLSLGDVRAGRDFAVEQLRSLYRARWKAASPLEQDIMVAMAKAGIDDVPRSQIAVLLGRDSRVLSVPRERLIEKGIIESSGRGLVRFTLPGFASYIAEEVDLPAAPRTADLLQLPDPGSREQP